MKFFDKIKSFFSRKKKTENLKRWRYKKDGVTKEDVND